MKILQRYNIDNVKQNIIHCESCGHEINVTAIAAFVDIQYILNADGLQPINILKVMDILSECCESPDYTHVFTW